MAALPRVRQIEETLRQAQLDPRLISIICAIAERQRVQHQQIAGAYELITKLQDLVFDLNRQLGLRDANLKKLGVEEMLKNMKQSPGEGASVESVEQFDQDMGEHNPSRKQ